MNNSTPTPRHVAARIGMRRVNLRISALTYSDDRRKRAAANGYRGPLTRAEYAARARSNAS